MTPQETTRLTSDIMVDIIYLLERKLGRRLTSEEARDEKLKADILACAKLLRKYVPKKGKQNEHL